MEHVQISTHFAENNLHYPNWEKPEDSNIVTQ